MNEYTGRDDILKDLQQRVDDKILEPSNYDLLKKLVENADTLDEAIKIAELGTTYRRTGFHFDKKLEKQSDTISYFKKNEELSFTTDPNATIHKLIIGDNYPALLNLLVEYKGGVDAIYIDPPYGKDSMGDFAQTNYENAISRDNLLSMLYPRLWLAKQLLSDAGVIFCSIDDRNQAYLKGLFDEIFGEKNFIGNFVWRKKSGGGQTDEHFVTEHEYILVYRKTPQFTWLNEYTEMAVRAIGADENGNFTITKLEKWGNGARKQDRPTMHFPIVDPDGNDFYPVAPDGNEGRWRVGLSRMNELIKNNGIQWKKNGERWIPYEKVYTTGSRNKLNKSRSIIYELAETGTGTKLLTEIFGEKDIFANPKPVELIQFLLKHTTDSSVVLDFFAGSGTTGQAVLELNKEDNGDRQFILVTNNEITKDNPNGIAYDVTSKRLKRVMTNEDYDGSKDFDWARKYQPLGDNLLAVDIVEVANFEATEGKTPFDVIDEMLYGKEKLSVNEKIEWVAKNFEQTQKRLEEK